MPDPKIVAQLLEAFNGIPFNRTLGLKLETMDDQHVRMSFEMTPNLIGNFVYGILHGGVTSSVLDMAGGMVCMSALMYKFADLPIDELSLKVSKSSTINLQINFITPGKGTLFFADAWLIRSGSQISFAKMQLTNQEDVLIATAIGTYLVK